MAATHYGEDLRAIGQTLEAKSINVFELKRLADRYVIQGTPEQASSLRSKMRQWLQRHGSSTEPWNLGWADVDKLSRAGRAKRSRPGGLTEFRSLPNILRTIGAYLDLNEFELIELQKRAISITLSYRDEEGRDQIEDRSISSFYKDSSASPEVGRIQRQKGNRLVFPFTVLLFDLLKRAGARVFPGYRRVQSSRLN